MSATTTSLEEAAEKVRRAEAELKRTRAARDEAIVRLHRSGSSLRELATQSGLSPEGVRRVVGVDDGTVNLRGAARIVGCEVPELLRRAVAAGVSPITAGAEARFRVDDLKKL